MFASYIPEIFSILSSRDKYGGKYEYQKGRQHIILCGYIKPNSVSGFLDDFLHPDRKDIDIKVVILNR